MEVVGIEHENTILELKEKNQKLKRKHAAAEEDAADKAEEAKNLAVRLAVRPTSWPQLAVTVRAYPRSEQDGTTSAQEEVRPWLPPVQ